MSSVSCKKVYVYKSLPCRNKDTIFLRFYCFLCKKLKMLNRYKFSIIISVIICYLSLKSSTDFEKVNVFHFPHADKVVHLCMYFGFMSVIIFETFIVAKKQHSIIMLALIPFFYGITMEILQGLLTTTRTASVYDAIFNTLGVLLSIAFWLIIKPIYAKKF